MKSEFYQNIASILDGNSPIDKESAKKSVARLIYNKKKYILFTNEDMFRRIDKTEFFESVKPALSFVKELVEGGPVRVILYTRSQPDYIESIFMQFMHLGRTFTFEEFIKRYKNVDLSWKRVLDDIAFVIGSANVTAIPYESVKRIGSEAFYRRFLAECGVARPEEFHAPKDKARSRGANRSYSAEALKIALAINPLLADADKPKLRKFLQENYSTATHPKAELLTRKERTRMLGRYMESNTSMFKEYMPKWREELRFYV